MEQKDRPPEEATPKPEEKQRKPYTKPELVDYGSVKNITAGIHSVRNDFGAGHVHRR
jgi:hypothetical protein